MGTVFLWILLAVAAAFAILGFVFALLAFNREGYDDTGLLSVLATLQGCCDVVSAGVSSLLTSVSTLLTDVNTLLANVSTLLSTTSSIESTVSANEICLPISSIPSPGGFVITHPGCWILQNSIPCSLTSAACITVASNGVTIYGSGFDLSLGPSTSGIVVGYSQKFKLADLRIINSPPSNLPANTGLMTFASSDVTVERVTFNGSCNGALFYDADSLRVDRCLFTNIKHINASTGVNNFVNTMVVYGGNGVSLLDTNFVHVDGTLAASPTFNSFFQDSAFAFFQSQTTGLPVQGVNIQRVNVIDGAYVWLAPVSSGTVQDLHVLVQNPGSLYNMLEIAFGGPNSESFVVKDSTFRNDVAGPGTDGIICNRCTGVTFDNVEIAFNGNGLLPYNPNATGPLYAYFGAAIHMNAAFSGAYHHTAANAGATMVGSGVIIKNSHLTGALTSQATQRGRLGLFVDGNYEQVHVIDTVFENFGGYVAANASANIPQLPGGAIVVSPGNRGVRVSGCKIYNSANGSPQGGNGILFMGQTNVTVLPVFGSGTTVWPAAANCTAVDNKIFDNAGCAIHDDGTGSAVFDNRQAGNWAGSYCGINSPVIVAPGAPALAGQNI